MKDFREWKIRIGHDGILGDTSGIDQNYKVYLGKKDRSVLIDSDQLSAIVLVDGHGTEVMISLEDFAIEVRNPNPPLYVGAKE